MNRRQPRNNESAKEAIPETWEEMVKFSNELKKKPEEAEKNLQKLKSMLGVCIFLDI